MKSIHRGLAALALLAVCGCDGSLDSSKPNAPDDRGLPSDPAAVEAAASGSLRMWFNAWTALRSAATMDAQARTYSSSWNNGNMSFYSGIYDLAGAKIAQDDTAYAPIDWTRNGAPWQNDPSAVARTSIDAFWSGGLDESGISRPGFYAVLSSANDALREIRRAVNPIVIGDVATTKRAETIAQLMQGAALMGIALNFDKGYYADETTDLGTLAYISRKAMRDSAIARLNDAHALAIANAFTTNASWANGVAYTNVQIGQIAKTMVAMTLAYYPRDNAEALAVDWSAVAAATESGMKSDFTFIGDGCAAWCHETAMWMNSLDTGRLWTRVAYLLAPANQSDPFPFSAGNPQPNSIDKRLGDGSFGVASMTAYFGTVPKTANGGSDFAHSSRAIFRPERGFYHQSNIGHVRFDATGMQSPTGIYLGYGSAPVLTATLNDLLWAEALLRQGGTAKVAAAAALIDKTRVSRGSLSTTVGTASNGADTDGPCTSTGILAKDGSTCTMWSKLLYENEIELLGLGPVPYYNQRHLPNVQASAFGGHKARWVQGLLPGTPREMPVPYKELAVKGEALYTFGGKGAANSPTPP